MHEHVVTDGAGSAIAVLAKAPIPGLAKTRLIPRIGQQGAAAVHALMVRRTLRAALFSNFSSVSLWCAPSQEHPFFQTCRTDERIRLLDQPQGDLEDRMLVALQTHLATDSFVVLVGTDCPSLSPTHLRCARAALAGGLDAVFLPTRDGGYAAIGLRRVHRRLFESMPWGTSEVMAETRRRVHELSWTCGELPSVRDVDHPCDLDWLISSGLLDTGEQEIVTQHLKSAARAVPPPTPAPAVAATCVAASVVANDVSILLRRTA